MANITMPQLGETVTEGTITRWFKQAGDAVAADEILFEISTDKVDSEVPSPVGGILSEVLAPEGEVVVVGQILARIEEAGDASVDSGSPTVEPTPTSVPAPTVEPTPTFVPASSEPATTEAPSRLSPVVRRLVSQHDLDPTTINGTGGGGRITRADVERAILDRPAAKPASATAAAQAAPTPAPARPAPVPTAPTPAPADTPAPGARDRVVPLNRIRARTAEHMVVSKQTAPHVLTAIEVDYERVERVRQESKSGWKADEGFSLTYLPFIARAVVDALREFPHLNASFGGDHLVVHDEVNLAIAVDIDFDGLLAPVVKSANGKRLRQIARDIVDVASRSRTKQLQPDELSGGTFTLTNPGQYGTMMQFPIINQPQVAILSTDGVQRKPVVVTDEYGNESIAVHSVGVLAMAWDHRAFDGAYAAAFLHRVRETLENRDWRAEII